MKKDAYNNFSVSTTMNFQRSAYLLILRKTYLLTEIVVYTDNDEKRTSYVYNETQQPITKTTEDSSQEDPVMEEKFEYNGQQLIKYSVYHDKSPDAHYWRTISYDESIKDRVIEETSYDKVTGITTTIKNNTVIAVLGNKLISRTTRNFDDKEQLTEEVTEDNKGKRIYSYQYDDNGNLLLEERYLRNAIYFKIVNQYSDTGRLEQQTVIDTENGSYMEFYEYAFFDN